VPKVKEKTQTNWGIAWNWKLYCSKKAFGYNIALRKK